MTYFVVPALLAFVLVVASWCSGALDRAILRVAIAMFVWLAVGSAAFASDTTVQLLPWYQILEPYILVIFGVVFPIGLAWALALLQKKTGIQVSQDARAIIQQAAMNAAGRVLASQEGNIAHLKFDVHNEAVKREIDVVAQAVPAQLQKLGMTPDKVGDLIVGKIGQLQAAATVAPVATTVTAGTEISKQVGL